MDAGRRQADLRLGVLCFTAGALGVCALPALPPLTSLALLVVPALLPWRFRALYAWMGLGVLLAVWHAQSLLDQRWPADRYGEEVWVQGHIATLPEFTQKESEAEGAAVSGNWRFIFATQDTGVPPRIRTAWYRTDQIIKGGECWRFKLRLKAPHGSANPGGFDYEGYLFRQGIGATATVKEAVPCVGSGEWLLRTRQSIADRMQSWMPDHPGLGLFKALTLGDTSGLSRDDWAVFRVTGTTHLVAISGFNIGIAAGCAFFLFRWLWVLWPRLCLWLPAQKAGMAGAVVVALFYALLAGWEPPVQRAFLMLLFITVAVWRNRLHQLSHVYALAWLVILLMDPFAVLSPGLWLSFGAVAAIFYVMSDRLRARGWLKDLLLLQLILSVALAPLTVYFFHGVSWLSPLLNLIAVPVVTLLTPLLLIVMLLAWVWPAWGLPLVGCAADLLAQLHAALQWLATNIPHLWIPLSAAPAALILAVIGAVLLFVPRRVPLRVLAVSCFVPLFFPFDTAPKQGFELTALDVGQGLSVVVRTAHHTLLFDTGPAFEEGFDAGAAIVAPYLLTQGVRDLDLMIISHADKDHSGGAPAIRSLLNVERELGALTSSPCHDGQQWDWDGVHFEMLHPDLTPGGSPYSTNNSGCVLRIETGPYAALLPADIEKAAERRLVAERLTSLQADVLIAPHHGSRTSSTEDFITAVQPQIVIHSAAWHSQFHHPHPSVVTRYQAMGAKQLVTGLGGMIQLHITEHGVSMPTQWRLQEHRFWQIPAESLLPPRN
jgi:competence protein ComEC